MLSPIEDPAIPAWLGMHKENRKWVAMLAMGREHKRYLRMAFKDVPTLLRMLHEWVRVEQETIGFGTLDGPCLFAEHAAMLTVLEAEAQKQGVRLG